MSEYLGGWLLLYGALHQLYLALWAWVAATVALAELVFRLRTSRRRALFSSETLTPLAIAVLGVGLVGLFVLVDGGGTFAQWYMQLYGLLFLS